MVAILSQDILVHNSIILYVKNVFTCTSKANKPKKIEFNVLNRYRYKNNFLNLTYRQKTKKDRTVLYIMQFFFGSNYETPPSPPYMSVLRIIISHLVESIISYSSSQLFITHMFIAYFSFNFSLQTVCYRTFCE